MELESASIRIRIRIRIRFISRISIYRISSVLSREEFAGRKRNAANLHGSSRDRLEIHLTWQWLLLLSSGLAIYMLIIITLL